MKTFVLPRLDFMMLKGDVGEEQLMKMDKHIRGRVDEFLKMRGLPVECHHTSWREIWSPISSTSIRLPFY
jgi:hypothetical protein